MELMALLELLKSIPDEQLLVQADSQYVINIFTEWLPGWKARGMRTSSRKPVENQDLIMAIDDLMQSRRIEWEWIRGHAGHALNEKADALARFGAERARTLAQTGQLPTRQVEPPRHTSR